MAFVRKTKSGKYELRIRSKLLPKDVYLTFDDEAEAHSYGDQAKSLLADGIVPAAFLDTKVKPLDTVAEIVRAWRFKGDLSESDDDVLNHVLADLGRMRLDELTYKWAEAWVAQLKRKTNLAPGTIRKRVGGLARAIDWYLRSHPDIQIANPLRLLPRGYAAYTTRDAEALKGTEAVVKVDVERDRRLLPGEEAAIMRALDGEKRPDRERALPADPAFRLLFLLILNTGVRLREAYTLRRRQVAETFVRVQSGKSRAGVPEYRNVPLVRHLRPLLADWVKDMELDQLIFPYWDGDPDELPRVTSKLSRRFGTLFEYAGALGMTEHDLRHEATCRWFEMRAADGNWLYREGEIRKIMGWSAKSPMPARYASFRAEDLAARL